MFQGMYKINQLCLFTSLEEHFGQWAKLNSVNNRANENYKQQPKLPFFFSLNVTEILLPFHSNGIFFCFVFFFFCNEQKT